MILSRPMGEVSRADKRACLVRELRLRKKAYPRWVKLGKMRPEDADREIATMEAIVTDYTDQGDLL